MTERTECLMRIIVGIVTGIILYVWGWFTLILFVVNWFYCIFTNEKLKEVVRLCGVYTAQFYSFLQYMIFATNKRPFPFGDLAK